MVLVKGYCRNSHTSLTESNNSCCTTSLYCNQRGCHNGPYNTHHKIQTPGYLQKKMWVHLHTKKNILLFKVCKYYTKNCGLIPMTDITIKDEKEKGLWFWYSLNSWHFPLNKIIWFQRYSRFKRSVYSHRKSSKLLFMYIYIIYIK